MSMEARERRALAVLRVQVVLMVVEEQVVARVRRVLRDYPRQQP